MENNNYLITSLTARKHILTKISFLVSVIYLSSFEVRFWVSLQERFS